MPATSLTAAIVPCTLGAIAFAAPPLFIDATDSLGLGGVSCARVCFADLNNDGRPDAILDRRLIYINVPNETARVAFELLPDTGLPEPEQRDLLVFADLDGDSILDAITTRWKDETTEADGTAPDRPNGWMRGDGSGRFGSLKPLPFPTRPTAAIAVGDANLDGRLDLYLGNWYTRYGESLEAAPNDLILSTPSGYARSKLPTDGIPFTEDEDAGGRPTYGVRLVDLLGDGRPALLDLNYGRRANRILRPTARGFEDQAAELGLDGDDQRDGVYPDWVRAKGRENEQRFRANGNTFDASVADIDNDGDLDLFVSTIRHAWAGESSDISRFLVQENGHFVSPPRIAPPRDREPEDRWNFGDLYCQLADLNLDGLPDLLLSSGDYPDDQRLRLFVQRPDGTFADETSSAGIDHDGSQQLSIADVDQDGDLDILVGQTFFRYTKELRAGREPRVRLLLNQAIEQGRGHALAIKLIGDTDDVNTAAIGAVVRVTADLDGDPTTPSVTQTQLLDPIGGHQGKQNTFALHFGIGAATQAERVEITWPDVSTTKTVLTDVPAGLLEARSSAGK